MKTNHKTVINFKEFNLKQYFLKSYQKNGVNNQNLDFHHARHSGLETI